MAKDLEYKNFPEQYIAFLKMCEDIPVEGSEPLKQEERFGFEKVLTRTSFTLGNPDTCELSFSYTSSIDRKSLDEFVNDYVNKEEILDKAKSVLNFGELSDLSDCIDSDYHEAIKINTLEVPSDFIGSVVTPSLSILLSEDLVQGMVTDNNGKATIFYGHLDENGLINQIIASSCDNVLDLAEDDDDFFIDGLINVNNIKEKLVKRENKQTIDFRTFLAENNLELMYKNPISALYYSQNALMNLNNNKANSK